MFFRFIMDVYSQIYAKLCFPERKEQFLSGIFLGAGYFSYKHMGIKKRDAASWQHLAGESFSD